MEQKYFDFVLFFIAKRVMFTAYLDIGTSLESSGGNMVVKFNQVVSNDGDGYDPFSGEYFTSVFALTFDRWTYFTCCFFNLMKTLLFLQVSSPLLLQVFIISPSSIILEEVGTDHCS